MDLHAQAVAAGYAGACETARLDFVAAAEHALRVGRDPVRLFAAMVRRSGKLRGVKCLYIAQADEDAAGARLKLHLHGQEPRRRGNEPRPDEPRPSGSGLASGPLPEEFFQ